MKTKDLVKLLLEEDPTGEAEVCVGNTTIYDTKGVEPCYYDGRYIEVKMDPEARTRNNCNGVTEVVVRSKGTKLNLLTIDMEDAFLDNPEAVFTIENTMARPGEWTETVEEYRKQGRELHGKLEQMQKEHDERNDKENS